MRSITQELESITAWGRELLKGCFQLCNEFSSWIRFSKLKYICRLQIHTRIELNVLPHTNDSCWKYLFVLRTFLPVVDICLICGV